METKRFIKITILILAAIGALIAVVFYQIREVNSNNKQIAQMEDLDTEASSFTSHKSAPSEIPTVNIEASSKENYFFKDDPIKILCRVSLPVDTEEQMTITLLDHTQKPIATKKFGRGREQKIEANYTFKEKGVHAVTCSVHHTDEITLSKIHLYIQERP